MQHAHKLDYKSILQNYMRGYLNFTPVTWTTPRILGLFNSLSEQPAKKRGKWIRENIIISYFQFKQDFDGKVCLDMSWTWHSEDNEKAIQVDLVKVRQVLEDEVWDKQQ